MDSPWTWTVHGDGQSTDSPWPWTVHGHGRSMAMDCPWPWTVHGHELRVSKYFFDWPQKFLCTFSLEAVG